MTANPEANWMAQAECAGCDPDLFYPERGASTKEAKAVCAVCTVRQPCLDYAISLGLAGKFGIWGGLSERQRRTVRKGNGRARTECRNGHNLTPENTYLDTNGVRRCKQCRNDTQIRYRRNHQPAPPPAEPDGPMGVLLELRRKNQP